MKIINLTPHPLNLVDESGEIFMTLPKGEVIPRLSHSTEKVGEVEGIPITRTSFGKVQDLPEPEEGKFFVVSRLVMAACPNRNDLLVPNELVRDEEGHMVGCKSFANN